MSIAKWWFRIVVGVLVVFGILYWLGLVDFYKKAFDGYLNDRFIKNYYQKQEELSAKLKQMYKNDKYGGDTPQETLDLFIDALKKGDVDLASKYFVPEKQEQMKYEIGVAKEKGFIQDFLDDFSRIDSGMYYEDDDTKFQFVVLGKEGKWKGVVEFTYDFILNQETNKWKILDL